MLVIKLFQVCKDSARSVKERQILAQNWVTVFRRDTLDVKYPALCATIADAAFRNQFRDEFIRLDMIRTNKY